MRLLFLIFLLTASAGGLYFSRGHLFDGPQKMQVALEKQTAIKPKRNREEVVPSSNAPVYTFFETLNDPTMTRYVDLKGQMLPVSLPVETIPTNNTSPENTASSLIPAIETIDKPAPVIKLKKIETQESIVASIPVKTSQTSYAVQVSSFRQIERANALKSRLQKKGFDAFFMRVELGERGSTWYRVFLGRYGDEIKAQEAANLAKSQFKLNAVVVSKTN